jgi:predicted DNA-binding protein YlxM (UPF0122 family)
MRPAKLKINDNGKMLTLREIAEKYDVDLELIKNRYTRGDKTIAELIRKIKYRTINDNGELLKFSELAKKYNISMGLILNRWYRGHRTVEALTAKRKDKHVN